MIPGQAEIMNKAENCPNAGQFSNEDKLTTDFVIQLGAKEIEDEEFSLSSICGKYLYFFFSKLGGIICIERLKLEDDSFTLLQGTMNRTRPLKIKNMNGIKLDYKHLIYATNTNN